MPTNTIFAVISLIVLFYVLGKAADFVVTHVKSLGERIGVKIYFLGLILGLLTSLPELSIGLNAAAKDITEISFGNLMGGLAVLFGLILGLSAILNRRLGTDGKPGNALLMLGYCFLPLILGLDGVINTLDAIILVLTYFFLIYYLYKKIEVGGKIERVHIHYRDFIQRVFFILAGLIIVVVASNLIIRITLLVLENFHISSFVVGLIFFSLGTNLPEIMVTLRSWRRHIKELSLSNLMGSAIANALIVGVVGAMRPIPVAVNPAYYALVFSILILFAVVFNFYKNDRAFTRREGFVLIGLYVIFALTQANFLISK